jgi:hypothetical protein
MWNSLPSTYTLSANVHVTSNLVYSTLSTPPPFFRKVSPLIGGRKTDRQMQLEILKTQIDTCSLHTHSIYKGTYSNKWERARSGGLHTLSRTVRTLKRKGNFHQTTHTKIFGSQSFGYRLRMNGNRQNWNRLIIINCFQIRLLGNFSSAVSNPQLTQYLTSRQLFRTLSLHNT